MSTRVPYRPLPVRTTRRSNMHGVGWTPLTSGLTPRHTLGMCGLDSGRRVDVGQKDLAECGVRGSWIVIRPDGQVSIKVA